MFKVKANQIWNFLKLETLEAVNNIVLSAPPKNQSPLLSLSYERTTSSSKSKDKNHGIYKDREHLHMPMLL